MNAHRFHALVGELIDDNPFACRALLKILTVEFTDRVPTLAVTVSSEPRLLVNLGFIARHCHSDEHVKAVICHEFLHVLLRHTDRFTPGGAAEHLALDSVINAIIHRTLGAPFSDFMAQYYAREEGLLRLLRPCIPYQHTGAEDPVLRAWAGLYEGRLVADDIRELAQSLAPPTLPAGAGPAWLGNHDSGSAQGARAEVSSAVAEALDRALQAMNGEGIWRAPHGRGVAATAYQNAVTGADQDLESWRRETWRVLRRHLLPDPRAPRTETAAAACRLPVLSPGDRRSFARALWDPLLPESAWQVQHKVQGGTAHVYLDVSGSMYHELPLIVALLNRLGRHIRRPFWAFSNVVAPAVIRDNQLVADTTGGTSIACVLAHLAECRPARALVVTDGYIERVPAGLLEAARATRLHALVTRDGSARELQRAGIGYTQLGRLPR